MSYPLSTPRRKKPFVMSKNRIRVRNGAEHKGQLNSTRPNQINPFKIKIKPGIKK